MTPVAALITLTVSSFFGVTYLLWRDIRTHRAINNLCDLLGEIDDNRIVGMQTHADAIEQLQRIVLELDRSCKARHSTNDTPHHTANNTPHHTTQDTL